MFKKRQYSNRLIYAKASRYSLSNETPIPYSIEVRTLKLSAGWNSENVRFSKFSNYFLCFTRK